MLGAALFLTAAGVRADADWLAATVDNDFFVGDDSGSIEYDHR